MDLTKLFGMMENYANAKSELIDATHENIKVNAVKGDSNAKLILNNGNEKEVRRMINIAINKKMQSPHR